MGSTSLWADDSFKIIWLFIAGIASVASILHTTVGTSEKLNNLSGLYTEIIPIRIQYESLREDFSIYPEINVPEYHEKARKLKDELKKIKSRFQHGLFITEKLRTKTKIKLNHKLGMGN